MTGSSPLKVDFWDVGQGDSSVIQLPDRKLIIIDVGDKNSPIVSWLSRRPRKIHSIIISHNDSDHVGGLLPLLNIPGINPEKIFLIHDRSNWNRNLLQCLKRFKDIVRGIQSDDVVWRDDTLGLELVAVHPTFYDEVGYSGTNRKSAILLLQSVDQIFFVWPGDARISTIHEKLESRSTYLIVGPHHGAPEDRKLSQFWSNVDAIDQSRSFISVGTHNRYHHPISNYIKRLRDKPCRVVCSQITRMCDRYSVSNNLPVLDGSQLLGLVSSRKGVPCRGSMRFYWNNGEFIPDDWDNLHLEKVRKLNSAKCVS